MLKLLSWNVNGVRAILNKGFLDWLHEEQPDILCLQETKAHPGQLPPALLEPDGYATAWCAAQRKGYSGVGTFYKSSLKPLTIAPMGAEEFDREGRVQVSTFNGFTLVNAYFPNSQDERARLPYKLDFIDAMIDFCNHLRKKKQNVVITGDFNVAHERIDLARPDDNKDSPGFYIEEREAMTKFLAAGYIDTFRHFEPGPGHYTWWSYRSGARERNVGWRIDYFCVNREFLPKVVKPYILPHVMGSDHCPVGLIVKE
ncbi:MAG: exodeoxyribonuclease III [Myxococcales bacterium]|nr:MAG: exodeoxyribonuclease III [Myxococcales bacterium]